MAAEVPFDPAERWGMVAQPFRPGRRGFRVTGTLDGIAFESLIVRRSRRAWLLLGEELLRLAGVGEGDEVRFSIEPLFSPPPMGK